jgi:nucleoside 2-deoxyribosyltransferase
MKRLFITSTFKEQESRDEVSIMSGLAKAAGWQDFSFVRDTEHFQQIFANPKDMMRQATEEIAKCDALLIDLTEKHTGSTMQAGIAYALGKQIIVIVKKGTYIKTATKGIAAAIIEYQDLPDILEPLKKLA